MGWLAVDKNREELFFHKKLENHGGEWTPCFRSAVSGKYECEQDHESSDAQMFCETDGHGTVQMIKEIGD